MSFSFCTLLLACITGKAGAAYTQFSIKNTGEILTGEILTGEILIIFAPLTW